MFAGSGYETPEFSLKPLETEEIPDYGTPELDEDLFEPLRTKWNTGIREFYSDATRGIDYLERRDDYIIIKGSLNDEFTESSGIIMTRICSSVILTTIMSTSVNP
jgi:hypothetical protein